MAIRIVVDIEHDRLDCLELSDEAIYAQRAKIWRDAVENNGGVHPYVKPIDNRLLKRMRVTARPALEGGGMATE